MTASGPPNSPFAAFLAVPQALAKAQVEFAAQAAQAWFRLWTPGGPAPSPAAIAEAIVEAEQQMAQALHLPEAPDPASEAFPKPPAPQQPSPAPAATPTSPKKVAPSRPAAAARPKASSSAARVAAPVPVMPAPKPAEAKTPSIATPPAKAPAERAKAARPSTAKAPATKAAAAKVPSAKSPDAKPAPRPAPAVTLVPEAALAFDDAFVTPRMPPLLDAPEGKADDFSAIKGIGPKLSRLLNELGVHHYRQIALWTPEEIAWINDKLDFKGRVQREKWVQQARALAGLG